MWYDVLVACILLFFVIRGAARGLIWQLAGIASILLCVAFAGTASNVIGPHINLAPPTNQWAVMFITYLLASFVAFGFARTLNSWINKLELKEFNRHLGALFGMLKGALLVLIMTFMIVTFSEKSRDMLTDSRAAQIAAKIIYQIEPVVPDKLHAQVAHYIDMFEKTGFAKKTQSLQEEVLPVDETVAEGGQAPVSDGTTLGQAEPFGALDWLSGATTQTPPAGGANNPANPQASDLKTQLQTSLGSMATRLLLDELNSAPQDERTELLQNLSSALQSADDQDKQLLYNRIIKGQTQSTLTQIIGDWATDTINSNEAVPPTPVRNSTPVSNTTRPPVSNTPAKPANGPRSPLDEIVEARSQFTTIQTKLKSDYAAILKMVPPQVSEAVLQDWVGDLRNSPQDLDPQTDVNTRIEERIINQLNAYNQLESKLPAALQERLKQFRLSVEGAGVLR